MVTAIPTVFHFNDGNLSASWFQGLQNHPLAPAVLYFNSCKVHNQPLETAILGAGARTYIGGNINLGIGSSEEVCKCFWDKALVRHKRMGPSLRSCEQSHYPTAGAHGISGDQGILTLGRSIALRAVNNRFVCAEKGGGRKLVADRSWLRSWETFVLTELGDNKVALRAKKGQYVCAEDGGRKHLMANHPQRTTTATFDLVEVGANFSWLWEHLEQMEQIELAERPEKVVQEMEGKTLEETAEKETART